MKQTKLIMGMPITLVVIDNGSEQLFAEVYDYFQSVDRRFSTYKKDSEISRINRGELPKSAWSGDMKKILELCEQTKQQTEGYFDIERSGKRDPSGLVKGWAIQHAAGLLRNRGVKNFYVDAGGDVQVAGHNDKGKPWRVGIRNPFNYSEIIKTLDVTSQGVATSGTYIRGQHIYNPLQAGPLHEIASLTVIGPNILDADRYATAAFAMGLAKGLAFIEGLENFEGYAVDYNKMATFTSGFEGYVNA